MNASSSSEKQAIVMTCAIEKGGTGKTTTMATIAVMLTYMLRTKVLLVDFDPQANSCLSFGYKRTSFEKTSIQSIRDPEEYPIQDSIVKTFYDTEAQSFVNPKSEAFATIPLERLIEGPDLLPIDKTAMSISDLQQRMSWATLLRETLEPLRSKYDYILIDTNPTGGPLLAMALCAAEYVLIPLPPEELAIHGLTGLRSLIREARGMNPQLRGVGIFFSKTENWSTHAGYINQVRTELKKQEPFYHCYDTMIKNVAAIARASERKSVVVLSDPDSEGARAYWLLLQELLQELGGVATARVRHYAKVLQQQQEANRKNRRVKEGEKETSYIFNPVA